MELESVVAVIQSLEVELGGEGLVVAGSPLQVWGLELENGGGIPALRVESSAAYLAQSIGVRVPVVRAGG